MVITMKNRLTSALTGLMAPKKHLCMTLVASIFLAVALVAAFPREAHALLFDGAVENLNKWMQDLFREAASGMINLMLDFMKGINKETVLTAPFADMLGTSSSGTTTVHTLASNLCEVTVKPIAHSILALVMLVQLVKISQRIDASATMPALKEIVFMAVFFAIFSWLINSSADLCQAAYTEVNSITNALVGDTVLDDVTIVIDDGITDMGQLVTLLIVGTICMLIGMVGYIVALVMGYARAIQLYVMMAFSPIPFALMGFEETRSMGVNFCKNFIALCIAGTIMVFLLIAFPLILNGVIADAGSINISSGADYAQHLFAPLSMVACSLLLIIGLIKSGAWARDILGG